MISLQNEIEAILNKYSAEHNSSTPDFILAEYLTDCLAAYDKAVQRRKLFWNDQKPDDVLRCIGTPNFEV